LLPHYSNKRRFSILQSLKRAEGFGLARTCVGSGHETNLNQRWVFYGGGVAAAMTRKWSLRTAPSKSFGAEFRAFAIAASFSKNGTTTKARTSGMERASDF